MVNKCNGILVVCLSNYTASTGISTECHTLSRHDALQIYIHVTGPVRQIPLVSAGRSARPAMARQCHHQSATLAQHGYARRQPGADRSDGHGKEAALL